MKWFKALGGLLAVTLLFASCIKVDGEVVVADDGSAEVEFLSALDADRIGDILGEIAGDADEICNDFGGELDSADVPFGAQNASVTEYNEDGFCGARLEYTLPPSLDHSDNLSDLFDENTRLYKEGDNWFFESQFSTDDITGDAEDLGSEFGDIDEFFGDAEFKIVIDLPGKAIDGENNATKVQNNGRFTWDIDLLNPPSSLFAQTEPGSDGPDQIDGDGGGGGGGGLLRVLGLLLILGLIGFGIWWFLKNRGSSSSAASPNVDGVAPVAGGLQDGSGYAPPTLGDGPPVMDAPVASTPSATLPAADPAKETIVMSSDEAQRLASQAQGQTAAGTTAAGAAMATGAAGAAADAAGAASAASTDPVWDEAVGAWVIDHPTRGRLRHDPATDSWNPI